MQVYFSYKNIVKQSYLFYIVAVSDFTDGKVWDMVHAYTRPKFILK